jgi:hypothetical protein
MIAIFRGGTLMAKLSGSKPHKWQADSLLGMKDTWR